MACERIKEILNRIREEQKEFIDSFEYKILIKSDSYNNLLERDKWCHEHIGERLGERCHQYSSDLQHIVKQHNWGLCCIVESTFEYHYFLFRKEEHFAEFSLKFGYN